MLLKLDARSILREDTIMIFEAHYRASDGGYGHGVDYRKQVEATSKSRGNVRFVVEGMRLGRLIALPNGSSSCLMEFLATS